MFNISDYRATVNALATGPLVVSRESHHQVLEYINIARQRKALRIGPVAIKAVTGDKVNFELLGGEL